MIILSTTQSNKVVATLREKTNLTNPNYTWIIENQNSFDNYIFAPYNFSDSVYYDAFTISIGTPSSLTNSVVLNIVPGEYHYTVYEMVNQYDLNITSTSSIVEVGILLVLGTYSINQIISFTESNSDTIQVFNEI